MEHKGEGYQGIRAIEVLHLRTKIQEVTYDYWEKWKKKKNVKLQLSIPGTQGTFSDKFTPEIYGFTAK